MREAVYLYAVTQMVLFQHSQLMSVSEMIPGTRYSPGLQGDEEDLEAAFLDLLRDPQLEAGASLSGPVVQVIVDAGNLQETNFADGFHAGEWHMGAIASTPVAGLMKYENSEAARMLALGVDARREALNVTDFPAVTGDAEQEPKLASLHTLQSVLIKVAPFNLTLPLRICNVAATAQSLIPLTAQRY